MYKFLLIVIPITMMFGNAWGQNEALIGKTSQVEFPLPGTYSVKSPTDKIFLSKEILTKIELYRKDNEDVTVEIEGYKIEIMSREKMIEGLRWIQ